MLLRALVLPREKAWRDHELVQQPQNNARVRYLVGLPLGTRAAPSRTAIGDFRRSLVAAGLGTEIFDQQVNWLGRLPALVDPQKDAFGIDAPPLRGRGGPTNDHWVAARGAAPVVGGRCGPWRPKTPAPGAVGMAPLSLPTLRQRNAEPRRPSRVGAL